MAPSGRLARPRIDPVKAGEGKVNEYFAPNTLILFASEGVKDKTQPFMDTVARIAAQ